MTSPKKTPVLLRRIAATLVATFLMFGGFVATAPSAQAQEEASDVVIGLRWKYNNDRSGVACDTSRTAESAGRIAFLVRFEGTNKATGEREDFYSPYFTPKINYCQELKLNIPKEVPNYERTKTFTNVVPKQVGSYVDGKNFKSLAKPAATFYSEDGVYWISLTQAANLDVNSTKLTGVIAPKHEGRLKVKTSFDIQKKGEERKPYLSSNRKYDLEGLFDFKDAMSFSLVELKEGHGEAGYKIASEGGDNFETWNEYQGKNRDYYLKAEFTDPEVAGAEYYSLNVTGDDKDGWNIELVSKLQKADYDETTPIAFKTERRANPNMAAGEEKVVQEGADGATIAPMTKYFYVNAAGQEQIVEELAAGETVTIQPTTRIVEYGTKSASENGKSEKTAKPAKKKKVKKTAKQLPKTGQIGGALAAVSGLVLVASVVAVAGRRRSR